MENLGEKVTKRIEFTTKDQEKLLRNLSESFLWKGIGTCWIKIGNNSFGSIRYDVSEEIWKLETTFRGKEISYYPMIMRSIFYGLYN